MVKRLRKPPRINWDFSEVLRQSYEDDVCSYGVGGAILSNRRTVIFTNQLVRLGGPPMQESVSVAGYKARAWYGAKRVRPIPSGEMNAVADELYKILTGLGKNIERTNIIFE